MRRKSGIVVVRICLPSSSAASTRSSQKSVCSLSSMILWVAMLGAMAPPGRRVLRTHESGGDGASKRQTPLEHVDSHKLRAILLRKKGKRDWQAAGDTLWWAIEHEPEEVQPIHFNIVLASLAAATEWERCLVLLEHDMPRSGSGLGLGLGFG